MLMAKPDQFVCACASAHGQRVVAVTSRGKVGHALLCLMVAWRRCRFVSDERPMCGHVRRSSSRPLSTRLFRSHRRGDAAVSRPSWWCFLSYMMPRDATRQARAPGPSLLVSSSVVVARNDVMMMVVTMMMVTMMS
jgi:hypothetical protein